MQTQTYMIHCIQTVLEPEGFKPRIHTIVATPNVINLLGPQTNDQDKEVNIRNGVIRCGCLCSSSQTFD